MEAIKITGTDNKLRQEWSIILQENTAEFTNSATQQKITIDKDRFSKLVTHSILHSTATQPAIVLIKDSGAKLTLLLPNINALMSMNAWYLTEKASGQVEQTKEYQQNLTKIKTANEMNSLGSACLFGAATIYFNSHNVIAALLLAVAGVITFAIKKKEILLFDGVIFSLSGAILLYDDNGFLGGLLIMGGLLMSFFGAWQYYKFRKNNQMTRT